MTSPIVAKLRYMARQYTSGSVARGGSPGKHYLDEAADRIEELEALADSEGTRAVEYLRRARAAEKALREAQPAGMVNPSEIEHPTSRYLFKKMLKKHGIAPGAPIADALRLLYASPAQPAAPAVERKGLTNDRIKAAFLAAGGSEEGWLDLPGSWFTEGYRDGITQGEQHEK